MGVNKSVLALFLFMASNAFAQEASLSLQVKGKSLEEILKIIEGKCHVFFSYDPRIFAGEPRKTIQTKILPLHDVLKVVLQPKFDYTIVGEYIVINRKAAESPHTPVKPKVKGLPKPLIADTILTEKIILKYDTQRVIVHIIDTTFVESRTFIYDTVLVQSLVKSSGLDPAVSVMKWNDPYGSNQRTYNGIGLELERNFALTNKATLFAGVGYHYLFHNYTYTTTFVNLVDSSDVKLVSERINVLNFLSASMGTGYSKVINNLEVGVQGSAVMYYRIASDEKWTRPDGSAESLEKSAYNNLLVNARANVSVKAYVRSFVISFMPFLEVGITNSYRNVSSGARYGYGIRLGIILRNR